MSARFDSLDDVPPGKLRDQLVAKSSVEDVRRRARRARQESPQAPPPRPQRHPGETAPLTLMIPVKLVSLNQRTHWSERHRYVKLVREVTAVLVPPIYGRYAMPVEVEATPIGVRHDALNDAWAVKAAVDGLVDQDVLGGDDGRFVSRVIMNAPVQRGDRFVGLKLDVRLDR